MRLLLTLGALLAGTTMAQNLPPVVEGTSGWLFTREELQRLPGNQNAYNEQMGAIAQVVRLFKEQGIKVVVVVVPTKASIYPEFLPPNLKANLDYKGNYAKVMADFARLGVHTVNLKTPLIARKGEGLMYFKTDTHWTPFGMQVAANAVKKALTADLRVLPERGFIAERLPALPGKFDLVGQLPEKRQIGYAGESTTGLSVTAPGDDLLGDAPLAAITLLGTSYSTAFDGRGLPPAYERIFRKSLSLAFQRDVLDFAVGAKGFWRPLADYAASTEYREQSPKLMLWEMPERYLSFEAPPEWAIASLPSLEAEVTRGKNDCVSSFATCDKTSSTMQYVTNWRALDLVSGVGTFRANATGFFGREGTVRHAGPERSEVSFWLPTPQQATLTIALGSPVEKQRVQVLLNGKAVKSFPLTQNAAPHEERLVLVGDAGLNRLEFRYDNWNMKTTASANGDTREIAVTFSKLALQR